jgi:receptor protein-tyrosine kinase
MAHPGEQRALDPPRRMRGAASGVTRRVATGLRSGWPLVLIFGLLFAALAYLASTRTPDRYTASARVFLDSAQISANGADPVRALVTQSQLAVSTAAVTQVSKQLHLPPAEIVQSVVTDAAPNGNYFTVTGVSGTAAGAVALVSAIEQAYEDLVGQQGRNDSGSGLVDQLVQQRVAVQSAYAEAQKQLAASPNDPQLQARVAVLAGQVKSLAAQEDTAFGNSHQSGSVVRLVEQPQLPDHPSAPRPKRNALLGAAVGMLLAGTILWWRSDRLATVGTADVSAATQLQRLAELPGKTRIPGLQPRRRAARTGAFAEVALAVDLALPADGQVLLLTSSRPADLAPEVAAGIAKAFAQDRKVVLVDGHPRSPALTKVLASLGVWSGVSPIDLVSGIVALPAEELSPDGLFVPAQDIRGRDRRQAYSTLVAALRELADLAIVVVPPPDASLAAALLASSADAAVLVVCKGTPLSTVIATHDRLEALECPTLGYVLDRTTNVGLARRSLDWLGRIWGRRQNVRLRPVAAEPAPRAATPVMPLGDSPRALVPVPTAVGRASVVPAQWTPESTQTSPLAAGPAQAGTSLSGPSADLPAAPPVDAGRLLDG